jgi:DNA mismatch repair protein MutL
VLYEENLKLIETGGATSQHLLFPVNVELSPDRLTIFEESSEILRAVGFVAELFGARTVLLSAVPVALARRSPERIFLEMLEDIENLHRAGQGLKKAVVQSMACRAAVMAGDRLTPQEALALLNRLLSAEDKYSCPHGRPTILKLSKDELDVKFGRK